MENMDDSKKQAEIVNEAEAIDMRFMSCIRDEKLRNEALGKAVLDIRHFANKEHCHEILMKVFDIPEMQSTRDEIHQRYEANLTPFTQFDENKEVIEEFKALKELPDQQMEENVTIEFELDIATQNEMVRLATSIDVETLPSIQDARSLQIAIEKLSPELLPDDPNAVEEGKKLYYEYLKSSLPATDEPIFAGAISPSQLAILKQVHARVKEMYKNNSGAFEVFK